ncbi:MAG: hypothetical protein QME51_05135, partial [Planctomycetota bacterium]|nr:hypothetical protein [Planctomycetota bacterium]
MSNRYGFLTLLLRRLLSPAATIITEISLIIAICPSRDKFILSLQDPVGIRITTLSAIILKTDNKSRKLQPLYEPCRLWR